MTEHPYVTGTRATRRTSFENRPVAAGPPTIVAHHEIDHEIDHKTGHDTGHEIARSV
ncbi:MULTISPECIES: hypothetical protein [Streptomyces]|uniref:hypothetical protein n=1 Tax=Streptomyces TaxID=1883 RepID=UPI00131C5EC6|nr:MULTISPECIES: hypothetical protein [Streptomyces]